MREAVEWARGNRRGGGTEGRFRCPASTASVSAVKRQTWARRGVSNPRAPCLVRSPLPVRPPAGAPAGPALAAGPRGAGGFLLLFLHRRNLTLKPGTQPFFLCQQGLGIGRGAEGRERKGSAPPRGHLALGQHFPKLSRRTAGVRAVKRGSPQVEASN